jgi:hypothetical protein
LKISRQSRSILEEINTFVPLKKKEDIVESRAQHIISSAINLFEYLDSNFSDEEACMLKNRFISSIKGSDTTRFSRAVKKIKEDIHDK